MPKVPKISVIIPTFNREDVIVRAINSALNQSVPPFEILVVDDGSTDNTGEVLQKIGDQVTYILQENSGPAAARNTGIRNAKGSIIAFLDSDDEWMPEKLEKQLALMEEKNAGIVITNSLTSDEENGLVTTFSGSVFADELSRADGRVINCFRMLIEQNFIHLSTVLANRDCFEKAGLFDETMRVAEDTDLWFRMAHHFPFGVLTEPLAVRDVRPDKLSGDKKKEYYGRIFLFKKFLKEESDLNLQLKKEVRNHCYFIGGRLLFLLMKDSEYSAALKHLLLNPGSFISKMFCKGFYWSSREAMEKRGNLKSSSG